MVCVWWIGDEKQHVKTACKKTREGASAAATVSASVVTVSTTVVERVLGRVAAVMEAGMAVRFILRPPNKSCVVEAGVSSSGVSASLLLLRPPK